MDEQKKELIKKIQTAPGVFTILSRATRLPYVVCDSETFNDQVWIFANKEDLEREVKPLVERKNMVASIKVENKSFLSFYTTLYTLGVNSLVFFEGDKKSELELQEIVKEPDFSALPENQRPLFNPQLQLSGIYFMQEFRRAVKTEEKENMAELEEEVAANLVRSRFLLAVQKREAGQEDKNVQVPYIKNKEGDVFQPVFTDAEEFRKFNKEKKFQALLVSFENLEKVVIPVAKGVVVNPQGFNLIVPKDKMGALRQRFQPEAEDGQK